MKFQYIRRQFSDYFLCLHVIITDKFQNYTYLVIFEEKFENCLRQIVPKIRYLETDSAQVPSYFAVWTSSRNYVVSLKDILLALTRKPVQRIWYSADNRTSLSAEMWLGRYHTRIQPPGVTCLGYLAQVPRYIFFIRSDMKLKFILYLNYFSSINIQSKYPNFLNYFRIELIMVKYIPIKNRT